MSFRKFGGLQYSAKNNAVSSTFSTVSNLSVTTGLGQANSSLQVFSNFVNDVTFDGKIISNNILVGQTGTFEYLTAKNLSFDAVAGTTGSFTYINNVNLGSLNNDLSGNTFLGTDAFNNVIKNNNTTNAQSNTAIGYQSLQSDISGNSNTALGYQSLQANTYGNQNTALGYNSGNTLTTGDYNTFIGTNTDVSESNLKYQYSTAIGYNAKIDASNQIILGGTGAQGYPSVKIPGNYLGIGGVYDPTNAGENVLDVSGNARISGTLNLGIAIVDSVSTQTGITAPFLISTTSVSGLTGTFAHVSASQGITAPTASFTYLSASQGITGPTASFTYLSASKGITGPTASFTYIVASQGITGYTGSFTYLTASTGSFNYVQSSIFNATSDYRIKNNIQPLDETFVVDKLNPVTYNNMLTNNKDVGLIAHEIQELYPYLVNGTKNGDDLQSVNYIGLIPILIKEIKEIKEKVKKLEDNAKI